MTIEETIATPDQQALSAMLSDAVVEVTNAVCESLLGEVPDVGVDTPSADERVSGVVSIHGAWSGDVEVRLTPRLAGRLAREVLQLEGRAADEADVRDVVGEVANMIGGNLKALLPEPCRLSLPHVRTTTRSDVADLRKTFAIHGEPLEVVVKRDDREGGTP